MINTMGPLMNAYYSLLNGQLIYNSVTVDVYKEDAPEGQERHYVLLRAEGEAYAGNKRSFSDDSVVIIDIITVFQNNLDRSVVEAIDGQIGALLLTDPRTSGLSAQSGMQILNVERDTTNYLQERNGVNKIYRKVSRYKQTVHQTA